MASRLTENLAWATMGAGLGYLLTRRYLEEEFQKRLDGQVENAEEYYRLKYDKKLKETREEDLAQSKEFVEVLRESVEKVEEVYEEQAEKTVDTIISEAGLTETLVNYQGMSKVKAPKAKTEPVSEEETDTSTTTKTNLPVIISQEAFMEHSEFPQVQQIYYAGDDVLATESNVIVSEGVRRHALGEEVVEKLRMGLDGDAEVIYVRNRELGREYEIFRDHRMYTEAVGPIGSVE